ncbi:MAG: bifunctional DNA-formamidopyrimidine glycosylase/DNA-(apurinic or apyrimidinic site) lyase [Candidatus Kerfeldbacteria bacterium]|nr:bifunctional DNA-formamidopyrimidine glycosylase/DNA-(apurinic or apyrimidinic site) lyase [Candidatus Kerfeldbacteria bacterium]
MPELPEVETIRRHLQRVVPGSGITQVAVGLPKIVKLPITLFRRRVVGTTIRRFRRRSKLLLVELSTGRRRAGGHGWTMIIHLKMSGQLIWRPRRGRMVAGGHPIPGGLDDLPNKYSHVIFVTNRGTLFFNDQRQFGFVKLVPTVDLEYWLEGQGYGPEPLSSDFTVALFERILRQHRQKRVKSALLDQHVVAGLGNIYADEACWYGRVRPTRRISSLRVAERRALYRGLRKSIAVGVRWQGTTLRFFRTPSGRTGRMALHLKVYGRSGLRCYRRDGIIRKITFQGRGTHFCTRCQR